MKPPIKDTPKDDKPPNKGQTKSTLYRNNDNLDIMLGPKHVHYSEVHSGTIMIA